MNLNPYKISEIFILKKLKFIEYGNLRLINYDGGSYNFGKVDSKLKANIKIHNPKFFF